MLRHDIFLSIFSSFLRGMNKQNEPAREREKRHFLGNEEKAAKFCGKQKLLIKGFPHTSLSLMYRSLYLLSMCNR